MVSYHRIRFIYEEYMLAHRPILLGGFSPHDLGQDTLDIDFAETLRHLCALEALLLPRLPESGGRQRGGEGGVCQPATDGPSA